MRKIKISVFELLMILILILTLIIYFVYVSLSWFTDEYEALVTSNDAIILSSGENLEISLTSDEENWSNYIELNDEINLIDASSDGNNFVTMKSLNSNNEVDYSNSESLEVLNPNSDKFNKYVYELDLSFRTSSEMDVSFGSNTFSESSVYPLEEIFSNDLERRSYFGLVPFSRDGISGASRVAFYEVMDVYRFNLTDSSHLDFYVSAKEVLSLESFNNNKYVYKVSDGNVIEFVVNDGVEVSSYNKIYSNINVLKNIWIPNANYELSYSGNVASFNTNGEREDSYNYLSLNNNNIILNSFNENTLANLFTINNNYASINNSIMYLNNANKLLEFKNNNTKVIKRMVIRIWIEGTDRECDIACDAGMIKFNLAFLGLDKEENIKIYNNISDLSLLDDNNKLVLYSSRDEYLYYYGARDEVCNNLEYTLNGIDWYLYNGAVDLSNYDIVYVRVKETNDKYRSNIIAINIAS